MCVCVCVYNGSRFTIDLVIADREKESGENSICYVNHGSEQQKKNWLKTTRLSQEFRSDKVEWFCE